MVHAGVLGHYGTRKCGGDLIVGNIWRMERKNVSPNYCQNGHDGPYEDGLFFFEVDLTCDSCGVYRERHRPSMYNMLCSFKCCREVYNRYYRGECVNKVDIVCSDCSGTGKRTTQVKCSHGLLASHYFCEHYSNIQEDFHG